ncbi:MAG: HAD family phosphatase [Desulfobulbaceae bacterium]|nr:HAD family phosphatase [Desulfobulbaceae bacterium]
MIKALIFDLDGTLANTEMLHYRAWKETLLQNGVAGFSLETFLNYVGTSNEKVATDFINSDKIDKSVAGLIEEKQALYMGFIPEISLCDGAREILTRYHRKKLLAVASSSHQREIMAILETNGLAEYFSKVIGGDMVELKKPDPEIYLKVQSLLHVVPEECIAFEDSTSGLIAAKNAGMYGVAIPNEFTRYHDFGKADRILDSLAEINDELLQQIESDS